MNYIKKTILSLAFCGVVACASTGNYNQGIRDFHNQHYRQAFIHLKPEAKKGNPEAQYAVGYMYYYGQGVVQNKTKAMYWIKEAMDAGQPDAARAYKMLKH